MCNRSLVSRFVQAAGLAATIWVVSGCSTNPLASSDDDYGRRVSIARLRDVESMDLQRYQAPPRAEETQIPEAIRRLQTRFDDKESVNISLEEARVLVLTNNLDLKVALINPEIANQRVSEEEAAFESVFDLVARLNRPDQIHFVGVGSLLKRLPTTASTIDPV